MKKYTVCLILTLLSIMCNGCAVQKKEAVNNESPYNEIRKETEHKIKGNYITFTVTYEKEEEKYYSKNYVYDLETKKVELMGEVECNAGYAVTSYDKWDNVIYYAHRGITGENHFIQVYAHDIETGEDFPMTDTLCAINYIIPMKDYIFVGSGDRGSVEERIYAHKILKEGKEVKTLFDIEDYQLDSVKYNPDVGSFYFTGQSYSFNRNYVIGSDIKDDVRIEQVNYIVDLEGNIISQKNFGDLSDTGSYLENNKYAIYYLYEKESGNYDINLYFINKEKDKKEDITGKILFTGLLYIDPQNNLYYIGFDEKDEESLVRLNLDTWESEVIFQIEEGDFGIDNGFVTG